MAMAHTNQVDLLLIGKTGNGKSAVGNSILKREAFESVSDSTSITTRIQYEVSEFKGRIIKVVDGPGVGDTRMNNEKSLKFTMDAMANAIAINPRGYHAFLLVVRFGGRFTKEDLGTLEILKNTFGQEFVNNFCVIVMTCGDNFERESPKTGKTFEKWCSEQKGPLQQLIEECDNRVVLFNNVTEDDQKKNKQIENLLQVVDNLSFRGSRYTNQLFDSAKQARDRFMVESKKSVIQDETMTETSLILARFKELTEITDLREKQEQFKKLQMRLEALNKSLGVQDGGTGALHDLCSQVETFRSTISVEIALCKRMMEERENVKQREETNKKEIEILEQKHRQEQTQTMQKYEELKNSYAAVKEQNTFRYTPGLFDLCCII